MNSNTDRPRSRSSSLFSSHSESNSCLERSRSHSSVIMGTPPAVHSSSNTLKAGKSTQVEDARELRKQAENITQIEDLPNSNDDLSSLHFSFLLDSSRSDLSNDIVSLDFDFSIIFKTDKYEEEKARKIKEEQEKKTLIILRKKMQREFKNYYLTFNSVDKLREVRALLSRLKQKRRDSMFLDDE